MFFCQRQDFFRGDFFYFGKITEHFGLVQPEAMPVCEFLHGIYRGVNGPKLKSCHVVLHHVKLFVADWLVLKPLQLFETGFHSAVCVFAVDVAASGKHRLMSERGAR